MFTQLDTLRVQLDKFYQYTEDMSFFRKQNKLHQEYFKLSVTLNQLLRRARADYYKLICS